MTTKPELYRQVFNAPGGREVLADLAGWVERMDVSQPGSAGKLIAHIIRMLNEADKAAPKTSGVRSFRASGGTIAHG